jgi:hypothetical protein
MKKSKNKKNPLQTEFTQLSTLGLDDSELLTTIFLASEEGKPVVLIRFANFDTSEQAQDFISVFKDHKSFKELGYSNETIH